MSLRCRQLVETLVGPVEEVADSGVGELRFGLERPGDEHVEPSRCRLDSIQPQCRLPGSRLAFQQERARPVLPAQKPRERSELVLPADDGGGHELILGGSGGLSGPDAITPGPLQAVVQPRPGPK